MFQALKGHVIFYQLFDFPTATFGSLLRKQLHSPDTSHCVLLSIFNAEISGSLVSLEVRSLNPGEHPMRFELGNFSVYYNALTH